MRAVGGSAAQPAGPRTARGPRTAAGDLEAARAAAALRSAARVARVGGWEVDFVRRQTLLSAELCELLGSPPLPAMPTLEAQLFWCSGDRAEFQEKLAQAERQGERFLFEGRTRAPAGDLRWWRLYGDPVLEDGRCVGLRGAAQDVTEWRDTATGVEAAVRAADAMSGFLGTMSHELRTPLNGVLGMAQAMGRGELNPPQRERLGVIRSSGETLLSLLDDLLDLSKLESGKIVLEAGSFRMEDLADGARALFLAQADTKGVSLDLQVGPGARGRWVGDPRRVRQILHNLVANAIKFTKHGSIHVEFAASSQGATFTVKDTGIGIPASALGDVFDKFVQVDASATRKYGGSGLGLTICRDLVRLMNGDIQAESVAGEGSTFVVNLPLARADAASQGPAQAQSTAAAAPAALRVLTAEDNENNQRVLRALLAAAGIETVMVANGQEALDAWRAAPWDIVLMDIQMPVMDGVTAAKLMRKVERLEHRRRTPIIAVTANAMTHQAAEYLAAGMDAMVAKPIDLTTLINAMDQALQFAEAS